MIAVLEMAREMLNRREMQSQIGIAPAMLMLLHVNNQTAISQIAGEASSLKAKYVNVRLKFLCAFSHHGIITACYIRSELKLADIMT